MTTATLPRPWDAGCGPPPPRAGSSRPLLAAALGLVIVFAAGFAPSEAVHNAAHDTRHSFAFPCH